MGKSSSAPASPNPVATANAQTASNRETAITQAGLNMVNQTDALGNKLQFSQNGTWSDGTPRFSATQTLSAPQQQLLNTGVATQQNLASLAQEQSGRLSSLLNSNLDFSGLPSAGRSSGIQNSLSGQGDWGQVERVEEAMFSRLNPQIDRQRQTLEQDLVNRGIRPGSAAYSQMMNDFNQGMNDQRTSILLNAGQEQNRLQQLALNSGNFANNAQNQLFNQQNSLRANALNELMTQRTQPLNEILALAGQGQVATPTFSSTPQTGVAGTDVAGIMQNDYNNRMGAYNQQQQGHNSMMGGLMSAGSSLLGGLFGLSDRRAKKNIKRVGKTDSGVNIYVFEYIHGGGPQMGVMAQELQETHPHAVVEGPDGLLRVNYAEVD